MRWRWKEARKGEPLMLTAARRRRRRLSTERPRIVEFGGISGEIRVRVSVTPVSETEMKLFP